MQKLIGMTIALGILAGCSSLQERITDYCTRSGYPPGSREFQPCYRQAEADHWALNTGIANSAFGTLNQLNQNRNQSPTPVRGAPTTTQCYARGNYMQCVTQ